MNRLLSRLLGAATLLTLLSAASVPAFASSDEACPTPHAPYAVSSACIRQLSDQEVHEALFFSTLVATEGDYTRPA